MEREIVESFWADGLLVMVSALYDHTQSVYLIDYINVYERGNHDALDGALTEEMLAQAEALIAAANEKLADEVHELEF